MAFDGFFCAAVANELRKSLYGARIEKINCRAASMELTLYGDKVKKYLYVSLAASANFLTVRDAPTLANDAPTTFCLLLRKHISAGKIKDVCCIENERILRFTFDSPDELGHISEKVLYAEIMGKCSNLILTANGRILGGLHTAELLSYKRAIMSGLEYELPPAQDKLSAKNISRGEFAALCDINGDKAAAKFLLDNFFCFSPLSAYETVYRAAGINAEDITVDAVGADKLYDAVAALYAYIDAGEYNPTASGNEFWIDTVHRYGGNGNKTYESLCAMTSAVFGDKAERSLLKERTSDLSKLITARIKRIEKKEALQLEELRKCAEKDKCRENGELITANIYRIKQGDSSAVCHDWVTDTDVEIALDTRLSPSANAERLFRKYRKFKSAEAAIAVQLAESSTEKAYLLSVLDCVNRCENGEEAELLRDELCTSGYINRARTQKKLQRKPCKPISYKTSGGFEVRVGRNNVMNDALTKSADKNDIWFHVKNFAGSHVILYTEGTEPSERDYTEAAALAAYHSSVRGSDNVEVDYTRVKCVRKPAGSKPGYVTYDKYYTAVVPADGRLIP